MKRVPPAETSARPAASRSVDRVCAVLSAFTVAPYLSLAELTAQTKLPKPTVHRLASALVSTGYLRHTEDGRYALGVVVGELSAQVRRRVDLTEACAPALDQLAERTGETVMLAAADWSAMEMVMIGTRVSQHTLSVVPAVGRRFPFSSSGALGKALLLALSAAELDDALARIGPLALPGHGDTDPAAFKTALVRQRAAGFATAEGEFTDGVSGAAVPVLVEDGHPRGAIGITGPALRVGQRLPELGRTLVEVTSGLRPERMPLAG